MWYYKKRLICTEGALRLPTTHDKHRIEGIHQMSIGILGGVLALGLVLIVVYVLVKIGLVSSCDSNATNKGYGGEDEQRGAEQPPQGQHAPVEPCGGPDERNERGESGS